MTQPDDSRVESLCLEALSRDGAERAAFLDQACAGNEALRREVEALLARAEGFLETPRWMDPSAPLSPGTRLGPYTIESAIGAGGMGEVYKARDTRLDRAVAIKILPPAFSSDPERRTRFEHEAKALAALSHPHICAVYDIGREGDLDFLVMEYIDGSPLPSLCPVETALEYAIQIADALKASHGQGIVHRDLKPGNVMVTRDGQLKVLDFGLAKRVPAKAGADPGGRTISGPTEETGLTRQGIAVGTVSYMSPEQVEGKPVDARSDIFSFGAVLYEMLTGRKAFQGDSSIATLSAILNQAPPAASRIRPGVPRRLEAIVNRCLEKKPDSRYGSAADLHAALVAFRAERLGRATGLRALLRPAVAVPLAFLAALAVAAGIWLAVRGSRARWVRETALPEIVRLSAAGPNSRAFLLAREAYRYLPDDRMLQDRLRVVALPAAMIQTTPAGALVQWREYSAPEGSPWETVGTTTAMPPGLSWSRRMLVRARLVAERFGFSPEFLRSTNIVPGVLVPNAWVRWRISKEGYDPLEVAFALWNGPMTLVLKEKGFTPPGMVQVPGTDTYQYGTGPRVELDDYFLDKYEVTNRQFKEFVDAGGYRDRQYWREPFVKDGRELTWDQAMEELHDTTGRPGPATWVFGTYPDGQGDFPVGGVSWFEAAAYAAFRGKNLPTVYHWARAGDVDQFSDMWMLSNFGQGPAPVGKFRGMSPWGAFDMGGNVKEWCANADEAGDRRYILGGGFGESLTMIEANDAQAPLRRLANYGVRCASYPRPVAAALLGPLGPGKRDYRRETPVDDETFRAFASMYTYDDTPLNAVASVVDTRQYWVKEKITFDAAYGHERVTAYLFLPRNAVPPYQVAVFFPSAYALRLPSSENLPTAFFEGLLQTGRAVLAPIYLGQFERRSEALDPYTQPAKLRDRIIAVYKDLARSIDYLETRPDIDATRLAYYGTSLGVTNAPIFMAMEPRLKASVLVSGGLPMTIRPLPVIDALNFAPRAKTPTLLIGGRYDFVSSVEEAQKPLIRLLGAPDGDKRLVVFDDAGHFQNPKDVPEVGKLVMAWLDKYLGPVRMK